MNPIDKDISMNSSRIAAASLYSLITIGAPVVASAHAFLQSSVPAVGSTVRMAPTEVRITFTEGVEPAFTTIQVTDAQGGRVDRGRGHLEGGDTHFAIGLTMLPPGSYHVTWKAIATDTHRTQGAFTFTVAP